MIRACRVARLYRAGEEQIVLISAVKRSEVAISANRALRFVVPWMISWGISSRNPSTAFPRPVNGVCTR